MKNNIVYVGRYHANICLLIVGLFISNYGFCDHIIKATVLDIVHPSAEEKIQIAESSTSFNKITAFLQQTIARLKKLDLSGIEITINNQDSSFTKTQKATKEGSAIFENIPDGRYEITAEGDVVNNGEKMKVKARTLLNTSRRKFAFLQLTTEWVTLKGKVLDAQGEPITGAYIKVIPCPSGENYSEFSKRHPAQMTVSDSDGGYELNNIFPLDMETTSDYLVSADAAICSPSYFCGLIYADKSLPVERKSSYFEIPLISEKILLQARRYLSAKNALAAKWGRKMLWEEKENVYLPKSKGDVIFLPDIILEDDKPK